MRTVDRISRSTTTLLLLIGLVAASAKVRSETIFADGFESDAPPIPCSDEMIRPEGWLELEYVSWSFGWASPKARQTGVGLPTYPNSGGYPIPVGARRGGYTVIPFTPNADEYVMINWKEAQSWPAGGYGQARPANGMFLGVSNCKGDFRPTNDFADDHYAHGACRRFAYAGSLIVTTVDDQSPNACRVVAGQQYYLNVMAADPNDGLEWNESSCKDTVATVFGCDVNARHSRTD